MSGSRRSQHIICCFAQNSLGIYRHLLMRLAGIVRVIGKHLMSSSFGKSFVGISVVKIARRQSPANRIYNISLVKSISLDAVLCRVHNLFERCISQVPVRTKIRDSVEVSWMHINCTALGDCYSALSIICRLGKNICILIKPLYENNVLQKV